MRQGERDMGERERCSSMEEGGRDGGREGGRED